MNRPTLILIGAVATLFRCPTPLNAQITLDADFDGASLDVANTTIAGSSITLAPRTTWTARPNRFRTLTFRAQGVAGKTPQFRIYHPPRNFLGSLAAYSFVYSIDGKQWRFFDNNSGTNSDFSFSNNEPFVDDAVFVSWAIPYPVSRARAFVEEIASDCAHVVPSPGADAHFVLGFGAGGTDDIGRAIPPQELLGVRITDDRIARSEKRIVVVVGGNHSGETYGNLTLEGFIRFSTSNQALAVELRERVELLFYPIVNPDGRYAGYYRSSPENPGSDYNRVWNNPAAFTDLTIVRDAMVADSGGSADMLLDFHSHHNLDQEHYLYCSDTSISGFVAELRALRPTLGLRANGLDTSAPPDGHLDQWAGHPQGLNAAFVGSPEACPSLAEHDYLDLGRDYAIALAKSLGAADTDGDQIPDHWERSYAPDLATLSGNSDLDQDGRSDRDEWLQNSDPTSGSSFFQPVLTSDPGGDGLTLTWPGHAGRSYFIESSSSLEVDSWSTLVPTIDGIDEVMSISITQPTSKRAFFRIITRPTQ